MARRKPKFRVGQVVMRDNTEPIKISNVGLHLFGQSGKEEWLYGGDGKEAWENRLRPLTARECGPKRKGRRA